MAYFDRTTGSALLKQVYDKETIRDLTYRKSPLTALMSKREGAFGSTFELPIIHGLPQGVAHTFAAAQTAAASTYSRVSRWAITPVTVYGCAVIDGLFAKTTETKEEAFQEALQSEVDRAIESVSQRIEGMLFREGYGCVGQIKTGSTVSGTTLTFSNPGDVRNIEKDMTLSFSSAISGATIRNTGGSPTTLTVTGRNINAGTATLSGNVNSVTGTIATDYVFDSDFRHDNVTTVKYAPAGLAAWVPASAPSSSAFFGVDRSVDSRLGGLRLDGSTGASIEELILEMALAISGEEGDPDLVAMSPATYTKLAKQLVGRVVYTAVSPSDAAHISFNAITLAGGATKPLKVVQMPRCPDDKIYVLDTSTWVIPTAGDLVHIVEEDGLSIRASATADAWEVRLRSICNVGCRAPGHNGVIYGPF